MPALLFHGREDSLVAVLAAGIFGVQARRVDPKSVVDHLANQDGADAFLVVQLSPPSNLDARRAGDGARELIRIARRAAPRLPILVVYDMDDSENGIATLIDGADAILPQPFHLEAFRAVSTRLAGRCHVAQDSARIAHDSEPTRSQASRDLAEPSQETRSSASAKANPTPRALAPLKAHGDSRKNSLPPGSSAPCSSLPPGPDGEALAELVKRVAHEVNNPLTTIRGLLQLLLHDTGNHPDLHETMGTYRTIEGEARRISDVVDELEYFSGMRRPARTMIDLGAVVRDVLTELGVDLPNRIKAASLRLLADREQVRFALRHQVGFLLQVAGPDHPNLSVKLTRHGDRATIRMRGHDSSLPDLDKALLPLLCGDEDTAERWSLAGADGIARAHGGRVAVKRRNDGRVEVRLHLPIRDESTLTGD